MVITYGIAMSMGWEKPFWAGLSVAFCSLATAGESIDRGVQRVLGTALAGVAVLSLMALFPQDRWLFLLSMSAFIGLCTYLWTSWSRNAFIWFNAGFNFPILALLSGGLALTSFEVAILRAQQTALGVVVYSLVAVLVWPQRGGASFRQAVKGVCDSHIELLGDYVRMMTGSRNVANADSARARLAGELMALGGQLQGAIYDSTDIWEKRRAWRRCIRILRALNEALGSLRTAIRDLDGFDMRPLLPGLAEFHAELAARLAASRAMLSGQPPSQRPRSLALNADREALRGFSHFQRAALLRCRDRLSEIDRLTLALYDTASATAGVRAAARSRRQDSLDQTLFVVDPDRLLATIRQTMVLWLLILIAIYVPAFPNVVGTVALANAFAMGLAIVPFVEARVLLLPSVLAAGFAGSLYIFVMPHLSGFAELGLMIFAATFIIGYLFPGPQDFVPRAMGLAMLVIMLGAENDQTYNFLYFANWFIVALFFPLSMMLVWRFPISFSPRDRVPAMLRRFFRSAEFLMTDVETASGPHRSWLRRWQRAFHIHEITVLPARLRAWGAALGPAALAGDGERDRFPDLLANIQAISDHLQAFLQTDVATASALMANEMTDLDYQWRAGVRRAFSELARGTRQAGRTDSVRQLLESLGRLEARFETALDKVCDSDSTARQLEQIYRALGARSGLSGAVADLTEGIAPIDFVRLQEPRF